MPEPFCKSIYAEAWWFLPYWSQVKIHAAWAELNYRNHPDEAEKTAPAPGFEPGSSVLETDALPLPSFAEASESLYRSCEARRAKQDELCGHGPQPRFFVEALLKSGFGDRDWDRALIARSKI